MTSSSFIATGSRGAGFVTSRPLAAMAVCVAFVLGAGVASAQEAAEPPAMVIESPTVTTAEELLEAVRRSWEIEKREDRERESRFQNVREDQRQLLADAKGEEARQEARSQALEKEYQDKEVTIAELEEALEQRMGNLGEL